MGTDEVETTKVESPQIGGVGMQSRVLPQNLAQDTDFLAKLDVLSMENVIEYKISRFLDQLGKLHPDDLYSLILGKLEKPLLSQILKRTGNNQVHSAKILGINRNTLRKKMKDYGFR